MSVQPEWMYDEFKQAGADFADAGRAGRWDERSKKLGHDAKAEAQRLVQAVQLKTEQILVDIGAGTGEFALEAAEHCRQVYALDVSEVMLEIARKKAKERGVENVTFLHAGFLSFDLPGPVDVITATAALHHLPDFWKTVALKRMRDLLRAGGRLYLADVILSFPIQDYAQVISASVKESAQRIDEEFAKDAAATFRDEFPTFDWAIEAMLDRCGFRIDNKILPMNTFAAYLCTRL